MPASCAGVIVDVRKETGTAASVIKPGWSWFGSHAAREYVGIGIQIQGRWHWRSYSLPCIPTREDGTISTTVKAMPEGFLRQHLVNGLPPGTGVRPAAPQGDVVLPDPPPEKVLFLAAGSGLTPVMGVLRMLDRRRTMPDAVLVHSTPTRAGGGLPSGAAPAGRDARVAAPARAAAVHDGNLWRTSTCRRCGRCGSSLRDRSLYARPDVSPEAASERRGTVQQIRPKAS